MLETAIALIVVAPLAEMVLSGIVSGGAYDLAKKLWDKPREDVDDIEVALLTSALRAAVDCCDRALKEAKATLNRDESRRVRKASRGFKKAARKVCKVGAKLVGRIAERAGLEGEVGGSTPAASTSPFLAYACHGMPRAVQETLHAHFAPQLQSHFRQHLRDNERLARLFTADALAQMAGVLHRTEADHQEMLRIQQAMQGNLQTMDARLALIERHTVSGVKDQEIDDARDLIRIRRFKEALAVLGQIRKHRWESLDDKGRYRVLANLAIAHQGMDDFDTAAALFVEAKQYQPDHEQACAFEALALSMRQEHERAFACAKRVVENFPRSTIGWATWVNSSPVSMPFVDVERAVPDEIREDPDVAMALARRAGLSGHLAGAESYARKALETCPDNPVVLAQLGTYILQAIIEPLRTSFGTRASPNDGPRVEAAVEHLTRALDGLADNAPHKRLSQVLMNRASAHRLLGKTELAERDIERAYENSRALPEVAIRYAYLLAERNQIDGAITSLRGARGAEPTPEVDITLAWLLDERGTSEDREEAIRLLRLHEPKPDGANGRPLCEYFATLFHLLAHVGRDKEASEVLEHAGRMGVPGPYLDIVRAIDAHERGDKSQATGLLLKIFGDRAALSQVEHKGVLARQLQRAGRYREAFTVWNEFVQPTTFGPYTLDLLQCGQRAGEDHRLLEFCQKLRANGFHERQCVDLEACILIKYSDYDRAIEVYREGISHAGAEVDRQLLRLRLSELGVHLKRPDLIEQDSKLLPGPDVDPRAAPAAVVVLRNGPDPAGAARFAYTALRRHFDNDDAHAAMIMSLMGPFGPEVTLPDWPTAQTGCAVYYVELNQTAPKPQFFILEDEESPNSERCELAPDHPTAKQLTGKRVDDEFILNPGAIQERKARITEIVNKFVARLRDCLSGWEYRFPHRFLVQQVALLKRPDGEFDFSPVLRSIDERVRAVEAVEHFYHDNLVPVHVFASSLGCSVFDAVLHIANTEHLQLRCCPGSEEALSAALRVLGQDPGIVLDVTALATVYALEALTLLEQTGGLIVVQSTLDALAGFRDECRERSRGGFIGKHRGRYVATDHSDTRAREQNQKLLERLDRLTETLGRRSQVVSGIALASMDAVQRNQLVELFGHPTAESIAVAVERKKVLWTDDYVVALIAEREHHVPRVWTHIVAKFLSTRGRLTSEHFTDLTVRLAVAGYAFTPISVESIVEAARQSHWDPDQPPLPSILRELVRPEISSQSLAVVLGRATALLWRAQNLEGQAARVFGAIFDHVARRPHGLQLLAALERDLERLFGLDVVGGIAARKAMRAWLAGPQRILVP